MTTGATCVDCNKVIAGFPAPGPGWATICNACERKRAAGVYQSDVDGAGSIPGSYLRKGPTGRWGAEISDAARKAAERYCGPEKPTGKVEISEAARADAARDHAEVVRLRKMDADIRGAILQRRFAEGGSDLPAALASMRHTFEDHSTMELVGWALRRMHSFRKDRDYWCVEHRRVRDEKEAALLDAVQWEKDAHANRARADAAEVTRIAAAGELAAYKRKFEIERATANDLRAQLSAKTSELVEARNAADENRRACASERALRVAAEGRAALLAGLRAERDRWRTEATRNAGKPVSVPVPSDREHSEITRLRALHLADVNVLEVARANWERAACNLREATTERDGIKALYANMSALIGDVHRVLDPEKGEIFETFHARAMRVRQELNAERGAVKERDGLRSEVESLKSVVQIFADIANDYSKALNGVPAWLRARSARLVEGEPLMWSRRDELLNTARAWEEEHAPQAQGAVAP